MLFRSEYFDFFLELKGIPRPEFRELLTKHYPDEIGNIRVDALDAIYAFTNGNPRMSLDIIFEAFEIAKRAKRKTIRAFDASLVVEGYRKRRLAEIESLKTRGDAYKSGA